MANSPASAIVVGAGIGGLTVASCLARQGIDVTVIEQCDQLEDVGAGIQLGPNAMQVLRGLGLSEKLLQTAVEPDKAVAHKFDTGHPLLSTSLAQRFEQRYGQKYLQMHRADLLEVLYAAAIANGATVRFRKSAKYYETTSTKVTLYCENAKFSADLLVGADGIHSCVRKQLVGDDAAQFTGNVAWRGLIKTSSMSKHGLSKDAHIWMGPGKHFVAYYVRGGDWINFVGVEERANWTEESWRNTGNVSALQQAFAGWDPTIGTLLANTDECYCWGLFDREPLDRWHEHRTVLLGDACHPMLPFMAQGAAMAIEDAWVLAQHVSADGDSLENALTMYTKSRKPRTDLLQKISRRNAKLFHIRNLFGLAFRRLKFALASMMPWLANFEFDRIYAVDVTDTERRNSDYSD